MYLLEGEEGNIVSIYEKLDLDVNQFRACLTDNCPFIFGFRVFESFGDTRNNGGLDAMA
jgi:hypothetical protein